MANVDISNLNSKDEVINVVDEATKLIISAISDTESAKSSIPSEIKNEISVDNLLSSLDEIKKMTSFTSENFDTNINNYTNYENGGVFSNAMSKIDSSFVMDVDTSTNGFVDYSVTNADLREYDFVLLSSGKKVPIYSSSKSNALYSINSGLSKSENAELISKMKGVLNNNQMAIITYNNDLYNFNISNKNACTSNYSLVAKTGDGKMLSFQPTNNTEIVVDDGSNNDTLMTSYNGLVLGNKMQMVMEAGVVVPLTVSVKSNIGGRNEVEEFTRLSFSGGTNASTGSEYASVYMGGDWQKYANTKENKNNGTWINEHQTNRVVTVGDHAVSNGYQEVGHVDDANIPLFVSAGNKSGEQSMQGTVLYHFDGTRNQSESKDMLFFTQKVVDKW